MEESSIKGKSDDLKSFLGVIWRRKWLLILTVVIITSAAVGATLIFSTKQYQSTTELLQRRSDLDKIFLGTSFFNETYIPERDMQTAAELVMAPQVTSEVDAQLSDRLNGKSVSSMVSAKAVWEADILRITATAPDPQLAADIANAFATTYIDWRREVDQDVLQQALEPIEAEVLSTPEDQKNTTSYQILKDRLETLKLIKTLQTGNLEIVKPATAPSSPSSPRPLRTGVLSLFTSVLLGVGLIFIVEMFDNSIRSTDEITESLEKPILTIVPNLPSSNNGSLATLSNPSSVYSESFRLLKTNLGFIDPDKETKSIMVSSSGPNEGKTTTIANLAITMARGGQRVIVLEADFRRPSLHNKMGLDNKFGLTNVISGNCSLREVLQMIEAKDLVITRNEKVSENEKVDERNLTGMDGAKPIYCATTGPLPPNPGEIASSEKLGAIIAEASEYADIVLVDAPPLGVVGDAASIAPKIDGIVLVISMSNTSKKSLKTLQNFIKTVPCNILGLVVNSHKSRRLNGDGYVYYDKEGYY